METSDQATCTMTTIAMPDSDFHLTYIVTDGVPWFRGKDVARLLGYTDTKKAVANNVDDEDRKIWKELKGDWESPLERNTGNATFINESGLYSLILRSQKEEAKAFQKWVTKDVLPTIRKTGSYTTATPPAIEPPPSAIDDLQLFDPAKIKEDRSFNMWSEKDLHVKVVQYIRRFYPEAVMMAGLGELQQTPSQRIEGKMKGYQKGCCDLMILNNHMDHQGLCIEMKNPHGSGVMGQEQLKWLKDMYLNGHNVVVSNDYDELIREINNHFSRVRVVCPRCRGRPRYFKEQASLERHMRLFHHNIHT